MITHTTRPILLAMALAVLSACSTVPEQSSLLNQAHADFMRVASNPQVARYAPLEMKQAADALNAADAAATKHAGGVKIDQLAYIAKQKIALTEEVTKEKLAAAEQESAAAQREQIRLAQRTQEADAAKRSAEQAKQAAVAAQSEAANAQRDAAAAQRATEDALRATNEAQAKNAQLEAQLAELSAKQTARGVVITFGDLLFGTDMAGLTEDGMRTTKKLADILLQNPERTVVVEGHTDSTGSAQYNLQLSERRAGSVRMALQSMGVGAHRITTRGFGEALPVASNSNATDRQRNRLVEIVLSDESGKTAQR